MQSAQSSGKVSLLPGTPAQPRKLPFSDFFSLGQSKYSTLAPLAVSYHEVLGYPASPVSNKTIEVRGGFDIGSPG